MAALDEVEYLNETLNQLKCEKDFLSSNWILLATKFMEVAANFTFFKGEANLF